MHGIRVYPVAAADGDRLTVELEMEWHSLADVALTASIATEKYLFKPVGSLVNLLARMLPVTVSHLQKACVLAQCACTAIDRGCDKALLCNEHSLVL